MTTRTHLIGSASSGRCWRCSRPRPARCRRSSSLAMTFAIGGGLGRRWLLRPGERPRAAAAPGRLGARDRRPVRLPRALLRRPALAPPAEAGLINYLWPLLIVLFSSLLPGEQLRAHHVVGALLGFAGIVLLLVAGAIALERRNTGRLRLRLRGRLRLGRLFGPVPPRRRSADRCGGGLLPATALSLALCHLVFETTVWPAAGDPVAGTRRARPRAGGRRLLRVGHRHEAGRHPLSGRGVLRDAGAVDVRSLNSLGGLRGGGRARRSLRWLRSLIAGGGLIAAKGYGVEAGMNPHWLGGALAPSQTMSCSAPSFETRRRRRSSG